MEYNVSQFTVFILIIVGVISVMVLLLFSLLLTSRNRRLRHKSEVQQMQLNFREELNAIRMDVADQTLKEVARDLHDEVGQLLTFSILQISNLEKAPAEKQPNMMVEIQACVKDALEAVRSISRGLSPDVVNAFGLKPSIEQLFDRAAKRTGLAFELEDNDQTEIYDPSARIITFHLIRESLTNAVRHAEASKILLRMRQEGNDAVIELIDNGKGIQADTAAKPSMGVVTMQQRAALIKGTLTIGNAAERGTCVTLRFPNQPLQR